MPFTIERNDLARMNVDVIVVAANERLQIDGGVGLAVARAAGLGEMQEACNALGGCPTGHAVATPAFALKADHVVHVVGPVWQGGTQGEEAVLRQAYDSALACADECGAKSIALPLISAHTFGFPVRLSFVIAVEAVKAFLESHDDIDVHLVLFGDDAMAVGLSLYDNIAEYIDSHYVEATRYPRNVEHARNVDYPRSTDDSRKAGDSRSTDDSRNAGYASNAEQPRRIERTSAAPNRPRARRSPLAALGGVVGGALEHLSDLRGREKEKPYNGSCVIRDEEPKGPEGPYLTPDQYYDFVKNEASIWESGICPHCGAPVRGTRFCMGCGHAIPADIAAKWEEARSMDAPMEASPSQTGQFSAVAAPTYEGSLDFAGEALLEEECSKGSEADFLAYEAMPAAPAGAKPVPVAPPMPPAGPAGGSLTSWLDQIDESFSDTLLQLIDARGLTDAQVYKRANMSRQLFSKIRCDSSYRPTKKTVLALSVALGLDLGETSDLLQRAGFALSHSSKSDIIVEYFIVNGNYDIFAINEALYAFDQPLL